MFTAHIVRYTFKHFVTEFAKVWWVFFFLRSAVHRNQSIHLIMQFDDFGCLVRSILTLVRFFFCGCYVRSIWLSNVGPHCASSNYVKWWKQLDNWSVCVCVFVYLCSGFECHTELQQQIIGNKQSSSFSFLRRKVSIRVSVYFGKTCLLIRINRQQTSASKTKNGRLLLFLRSIRTRTIFQMK